MKLLASSSKAILLSACLSVMGCHSGEDAIEPKFENFYTVQVSPDYSTDQSDNWVMASDKNGVWIDAQPFEAGATIVLNGIAPSDGLFTLHFFSSQQISGRQTYLVNSYAAVPVKGTWKLNALTTNNQPASLGNVTIRLTNFLPFPDNLNNISVSTSNGESSYNATSTGTTTDYTVDVFAASTDFMISFFVNGQPYYIQVSDVAPGSFISLDAAAQANPVTTQFTFDYTGDSYFTGIFYGLNTGSNPNSGGFVLSNFYSFSGSGAVSLGYIPGFDTYKTLISYTEGTSLRTYYKFGTPITQAPVFPPLAVTEINANISAFSVTPNLPFDFSDATLIHSQEDNFKWSFRQPKNAGNYDITLSILPFPSEMTTLFPVLDVSQMRVRTVGGTQCLDGFTYANWLNQRQNGLSGNSTEYFVFSKDM